MIKDGSSKVVVFPVFLDMDHPQSTSSRSSSSAFQPTMKNDEKRCLQHIPLSVCPHAHRHCPHSRRLSSRPFGLFSSFPQLTSTLLPALVHFYFLENGAFTKRAIQTPSNIETTLFGKTFHHRITISTPQDTHFLDISRRLQLSHHQPASPSQFQRFFQSCPRQRPVRLSDRL